MNFISIANKIGNKARREAEKKLKLYENITDEERTQLKKQFYQQYYKSEVFYLDCDLTTASQEGGLKDILDKHGFHIKKPEEKLTGKWFWITLRPSPEHNERFDSFKQQTFDYMKRKMFLDWKLVFEQKGETDEQMGTGYHVHIIANCKKNINKQKLIRDTKSTWSPWLNGYCPEAFIEIEKMETQTEYNNRIKYITGEKKDEYKHAAQKIDINWRVKKGLKNIYENN